MSAEVTTERFDYEKEIWAVANLVWGPIKTSEFNRVILPFTMLRRLECALYRSDPPLCPLAQIHCT